MAENFSLLQRAQLLPADLAARLRAMVGFRNVLVHSYDSLDPDIIAQVATHGAADLRAFAAWAVALPAVQDNSV